MSRKILFLALAGTLLLGAAPGLASDQQRSQEQTRLQEQDQIYGSQLMTREEQNEYRAKMRAATSAEERERIRYEHHEQMEERAKQQGLHLPDDPPKQGMGRGLGSGGGMGPGGGGRR
jgi:type II secretory pathway pseudopilin PulG